METHSTSTIHSYVSRVGLALGLVHFTMRIPTPTYFRHTHAHLQTHTTHTHTHTHTHHTHTHTSIHSFIHATLVIYALWYMHTFIHSYFHSFIYSLIHALLPHARTSMSAHEPAHPPTSFIHSFIHVLLPNVRTRMSANAHTATPFIHSFIHSYHTISSVLEPQVLRTTRVCPSYLPVDTFMLILVILARWYIHTHTRHTCPLIHSFIHSFILHHYCSSRATRSKSHGSMLVILVHWYIHIFIHTYIRCFPPPRADAR